MDEDTLPELILLENVVGFEKSCRDITAEEDDGNDDAEKSGGGEMMAEANAGNTDGVQKQQQPKPVSSDDSKSSPKNNGNGGGSFQTWRRALSKRNYKVGHFQLDPTHVGLPNNRPRHYTVAFRQNKLKKNGHDTMNDRKYEHLFRHDEPLNKPPAIHDETSLGKKISLPCVSSFLDAHLPPHAPAGDPKASLLQIPEKVHTSSSSWCFDIATPYHHHTSCFTHSYGKFIRGTGSILYTGPLSLGNDNAEGDLLYGKEGWCKGSMAASKNNDNGAAPLSIDRFRLAPPEERTFDASWSKDIDWDRDMRYFSGTEIARLMGFPVMEQSALICDGSCPGNKSIGEQGDSSFRKFIFPPECTMKRQWKLLGNSLNVRVAACVSEIGIRSVLNNLGDAGDETKLA